MFHLGISKLGEHNFPTTSRIIMPREQESVKALASGELWFTCSSSYFIKWVFELFDAVVLPQNRVAVF